MQVMPSLTAELFRLERLPKPRDETAPTEVSDATITRTPVLPVKASPFGCFGPSDENKPRVQKVVDISLHIFVEEGAMQFHKERAIASECVAG